jgi:hypothetical protein
MNRLSITNAIVVSSAILAAACGNGSWHARDKTAADEQVKNHEAVSLTGCLQKDGGTFVLTRLNEPVGTGGQDSAFPKREQVRSAENAFRLDAEGDVKLDDLVGKQIHVDGTYAAKADLPKSDPDDAIKTGDLTKVNVRAATMISDSCGGR